MYKFEIDDELVSKFVKTYLIQSLEYIDPVKNQRLFNAVNIVIAHNSVPGEWVDGLYDCCDEDEDVVLPTEHIL